MSTVLSGDRLPPEWSRRGVAEMLAWLSVSTVAAAGFAVAAARVWADGLVLRGELFVLFAAVIAGLAVCLAITFWHRRRGLASGVRLVVGAGQACTVFVPSAALRWTFPLTCAGASVACGWWGVLRLLNKVPWTDPATAMRSPAAGPALLAIAVAFAVACRALVRRGFTSRDGLVPGIQLSVHGLRYRGGAEVVLPWDSISGITAGWETGRRGSAPTVLITYAPDVSGVERGKISAPDGTLPLRPDNYAVGAPRLLHALRFYLDRPELRAELGTDASVTRIRAGFAA